MGSKGAWVPGLEDRTRTIFGGERYIGGSFFNGSPVDPSVLSRGLVVEELRPPEWAVTLRDYHKRPGKGAVVVILCGRYFWDDNLYKVFDRSRG